jgi:DNA-binding MarR family transcriptional regulator
MMRHVFRYAAAVDDDPWLDDDEQQAWRGFLRLQGHVLATLARRLQADAGLSLADYEILVALTDVPETRLRVLDLARSLDWEQSRMSHQVARMTRRGLVAREECADDGRGAFVVLTAAGRAAIEAAAPQHVRDVREVLLDRLTPAELATLTELARRVAPPQPGSPQPGSVAGLPHGVLTQGS